MPAPRGSVDCVTVAAKEEVMGGGAERGAVARRGAGRCSEPELALAVAVAVLPRQPDNACIEDVGLLARLASFFLCFCPSKCSLYVCGQ